MKKIRTLKKQWIYVIVVAACLMIGNISFAYEIELGKQGKSYAVLIGINNYSNLRSLQTPVKNVETLAKILTEQFDFQKECIYTITDNSSQPPTFKTINNQLIRLGKQVTEKDQLLIFFSGHSQMDENGDTYWIPIDGDKSRDNWMNHQYLLQTIIAQHFKNVRHLAIVSDGYFSDRLFQAKTTSARVPEAQYKEWLEKKSYLKSREIIAFNDRYWEHSDKTNGLGLFAFYLTKAIQCVEKRRADLETTLLESDLIHGPIALMTGVDIVYGRLKNLDDQDGQFVLEKAKVLPKVDINECHVYPSIGYQGTPFLIACHTTESASRVNILINGQHYPMIGTNTQWKYQTTINTPGKTFFYVTPINNENVQGAKFKGTIETVSKSSPVCNVVSAKVSPQKGNVGETFHFIAQTDIPAQHVHLYLDNERYKMEGKEKKWTFSKSIRSIGQLRYSVVTANDAGIIGQMQQGTLQTTVPSVNVIRTKVMPEWGYIGDAFVFSAVTDRAAQEVFIEINEETYAMKGSGRDWMFKTEINKPGLVEFQTVALNQMKKKGKTLSANFSVSRKPLEIPDVMSISVLPDSVYKGESILIHAKTTSPAKFVYVEVDNQKDILKGNGVNWFYKTTVHTPQTMHFRIIAKNHRGMQGLAQDSALNIKEIPQETIKIIHAEVSPKTCDVGSDIFFHVLTDKPAMRMDIILEGQRISMKGRIRNGKLTQTIDVMGLLYFAIIPIDHRKIKGMSYIDHIDVAPGDPKVKSIRMTPEKPSVEEAVTIHVRTDKPAQRMTLQMENITYPMIGKEKDFYFKQTFFSAKSYPFVVQPYNLKNIAGTQKQEKLEIFEPPVPVPQVTSVDVKPMETGFFLNETLLFSAETNADTKRILLTVNDQAIEMNGVKNFWHRIYATQKAGLNTYSVEAFNEKGLSGEIKKGQFQIYEKEELPANVLQVQVIPKHGLPGDLFSFSATTHIPANRVLLKISDTTYEMSGKDCQWHTQLNGYKSGKINFYVVALNQSEIEGMIQTNFFTVLEQAPLEQKRLSQIQSFVPLPPEERYIDHGNGTITDKSTQLMWLKTPKTIPETYDEAIRYCRSLSIHHLNSWRLPTIEEWKHMIDPEQQNPSLPIGHPFESIHTGIGYWSKTNHRFGPQYAYQMKLWYGKVGYMKKSQRALVWPVRYAGFD